MQGILFGTRGWLLAEIDSATLTVREFDWPTTAFGWMMLLGGGLLLVVWTAWIYRKDTSDLPAAWKVWLTGLRLTVLAALFVIALNPSNRTQKRSYHPSRVAVLVDTSLSMRHPDSATSTTSESSTQGVLSRADAVRQLLVESDLINNLRKLHEVSVFTFDSTLNGPHRVFGQQVEPIVSSTEAKKEAVPDWGEILRPRGLESRLGECLSDLIRQTAGRTLSGIVVVSDGVSNAGVDPASTHDNALTSKVRLITVGTGTTEQPVNLAVSEVSAPTDVQIGDPFDILAYVQGSGLNNSEVDVELLMKAPGDSEAIAVESKTVKLPEDGLPVEVTFSRNPAEAGRVTYTVRVSPRTRIAEFNSLDNSLSFNVNVDDRPMRVLLIAGGPMRDYQFVRTLLYRHKSFDVDVLLQTGSIGTSQESNHLLLTFPDNRDKLYEYDVVMAFDPDWNKIPPDALKMLYDWVGQEGGGLILIAGEVNTPGLAALSYSNQPSAIDDDQKLLLEMYPVILSSDLTAVRFERDTTQSWPVQFTKEGQSVPFLQLTDDATSPVSLQKQFPRIYGCYPTSGHKAGAKVYATFSDPRAAAEPPIFMAGQPLNRGFSLYLGSAELWRLRSVSENDYDRFWIKTIREVAQGRSRRGTRRGLLMPESHKLLIGQTSRVRARLLDAKYEPLEASSVQLHVFDPAGKPIDPPRRLLSDPSIPGTFAGDFRVSLPGTWKLEVTLPDSRETVTDEVVVGIPKLEDENIRQNVRLLTDLVRDTGGKYLSMSEAAAELPNLLPDRGEQFYIPERLRSLWDRQWVMYLFVVVLSLEWLTRKLLKLA